MPAPETLRLALVGNPNTGKTSLFNRLTGANARVGNYPGVTVEREVGAWRLPGLTVDVIDVPGTYSLAARSREEQVAIQAIFGLDGNERPHIVVAVVDATQAIRNLYFVAQLQEAGLPVVVALNQMDLARTQGVAPDPAHLQALLGVPVVGVSAQTGEGIAALAAAAEAALRQPDTARRAPGWAYPPALEADIGALTPLIEAHSLPERRAMALWALLSVDAQDELEGIPSAVRQQVLERRRLAVAAGRDIDAEVVSARYRWLDSQPWNVRPAAMESLSTRIDRVLLHPIAGFGVFLVVMGVLFQALFSWATPMVDAVEGLFGLAGELARGALPPGLLTDLLVDGLLNGVGSVVVFLPQILLLFLLLGFLEDSGYMARVAYLVDRGMRALGLHGRAFVPMLSGYACAVPAIMATRTLERKRDRLLTMLVVPLMSCSARLPVYTLIIASFFADGTLFGFLPTPVAMMLAMYLFSTATALLAAGVLGKTLLRGPRIPLLLELPAYRMPRLASVLRQVWMRARMFLTEAGTVITACTVVLWFLLNFPPSPVLSKDYDALKAAAPSEEVAGQLEVEERAERLAATYGGQLGRAIEPVIRPLGFDWKIGVGLVGSFAAREVFISTMGVIYGIGDEVDETSTPLREKIRSEVHPDGTPVYTPLTGFALMVFFALCAQCMSTLATIKRESGSWGWAAFTFGYMTALAWIAAFVVYQGGRLLGLG